MVVCRRGQCLAEVLALGKAAVLVPPGSADRHQLANAFSLPQGAAVLLEEKDPTPPAWPPRSPACWGCDGPGEMNRRARALGRPRPPTCWPGISWTWP